jgi:hypothetical protein
MNCPMVECCHSKTRLFAGTSEYLEVRNVPIYRLERDNLQVRTTSREDWRVYG